MRNVYNFSAGPAVLPEPVLQEAADEIVKFMEKRKKTDAAGE